MARNSLPFIFHGFIKVQIVAMFATALTLSPLLSEMNSALQISRSQTIVHQNTNIEFTVTSYLSDGSINKEANYPLKVTTTKRSGNSEFQLVLKNGSAKFSQKYDILEIVLINIDHIKDENIAASNMFKVERNNEK